MNMNINNSSNVFSIEQTPSGLSTTSSKSSTSSNSSFSSLLLTKTNQSYTPITSHYNLNQRLHDTFHELILIKKAKIRIFRFSFFNVANEILLRSLWYLNSNFIDSILENQNYLKNQYLRYLIW